MLDHFLALPLRPSDGEEWINRWGQEVRAIEAGSTIRHSWLPAPLHYWQLLLRPKFWGTITPLDFLSLPGFLVSMLWAAGLDPIREEVRLEGLGMEDFFRGWTPNLKATFTGLGHSLLAAPSESISLTAFIAAMRFYTLSRRDVWRLDYLPTNPETCLIQPMIGYIREREGEVFFGSHARRLNRYLPEDEAEGPPLWQIQVEDTRRGMTRSLLAEKVILAIDPLSASMLLTQAESSTATAAKKIKFPPALRNATIRLWFDRLPRPGAMGGMFTGDFLIDNFFWLHRMQDEFIAWSAETGGSAIEVHLYASKAILKKPDKLLIIEAAKEIYAAFPELRGHLIHAALRRNNTSQTQFVIPTQADSLGVVTPWPGIYACGDWIAHPHTSLWMERCTVTAIAAANEIITAQQGPAAAYAIIPARPPEWLFRLMGGAVHLGRKTLGPLILGLGRALKKRA
jgi:isorenieratene synthase